MVYACLGSAERVDYMWPEVAGVFTFNRDGGFRRWRKSAGETAELSAGVFRQNRLGKTVAQTPRKIVATTKRRHHTVVRINAFWYFYDIMLHMSVIYSYYVWLKVPGGRDQGVHPMPLEMMLDLYLIIFKRDVPVVSPI